jgi:hypothetical protein
LCFASEVSPRWLTATLQPCRTYSRAIARPIPVVPPVIAAVIPTRRCGDDLAIFEVRREYAANITRAEAHTADYLSHRVSSAAARFEDVCSCECSGGSHRNAPNLKATEPRVSSVYSYESSRDLARSGLKLSRRVTKVPTTAFLHCYTPQTRYASRSDHLVISQNRSCS